LEGEGKKIVKFLGKEINPQGAVGAACSKL